MVDKGQCLPHVISIWNVGKYKGNMNFTFMRKFQKGYGSDRNSRQISDWLCFCPVLVCLYHLRGASGSAFYFYIYTLHHWCIMSGYQLLLTTAICERKWQWPLLMCLNLYPGLYSFQVSNSIFSFLFVWFLELELRTLPSPGNPCFPELNSKVLKFNFLWKKINCKMQTSQSMYLVHQVKGLLCHIGQKIHDRLSTPVLR